MKGRKEKKKQDNVHIPVCFIVGKNKKMLVKLLTVFPWDRM